MITGAKRLARSSGQPTRTLQPTINELRSYMRVHLLPQKTPTRRYGVSGYPLNRSGKIQKFIIVRLGGTVNTMGTSCRRPPTKRLTHFIAKLHVARSANEWDVAHSGQRESECERGP